MPINKLKNNDYLLPIVIVGLFIVTGVFLYIVYRTFFWTTFITLLFYIATKDYYQRIKNKIYPKIEFLSPYIMILLVSLVIVLPAIYIIRTLANEVLSLSVLIKMNVSEDKILSKILNVPLLTDFFTDYEFFWVQFPNTYKEIESSYGDILNIDSIYSILSNAATLIMGGIRMPIDILINVFFGFILLFFFYKDGYKMEEFLLTVLPLSEEIREKIGLRVAEAMKAIVKGNILISLLQGAAVGILLLFMGIPSPILYGSIASIFSMIPIVGTMVVWLPAGLYIGIIEESWIKAIVFMSISFGTYLVLENLIKPSILDKKLNIHPFILFLALLGGIKEFGIPGIIIGPIAVTLLVILWEFWLNYRDIFIKSKITKEIGK